MSHPNFIKIKREVVESPDNATINPFLGVGVREMARKTGLDPGYLSRVKNGKTTISLKRYIELTKAWEELYNEEEKQLRAKGLYTCTKCGKPRPIEDFYIRKSGIQADQKFGHCKLCDSKRYQEFYEENKESIIERNERYKAENADKLREAQRRRSKTPEEVFKNKARRRVNYAIKTGRISSQPCEECGVLPTDFHHTNGYEEENALTGKWLCRKHHAAAHVAIRRARYEE